MSLDKDLNKEDASYSWNCPHCDKVGFTKWNKSCYYQLVEHCQEEHLEEAFTAVLDRLKRLTDKGKKEMINSHWAVFNKDIKDLNSVTQE
jgi:hypothetical protein